MASSKRVTIRPSQLVTGFGPGAMLDLPTRSVIVGGLDLWHMRERGSWRPIHEPRAVAVLEELLRAGGRLGEEQRLTLRTPPVDDEARRGAGGGTGDPPGIEVRIFPAWFVGRESEGEDAGGVRRRRLVRWRDLDPRGRSGFVDDDGRRTGVTPIRFVAGCRKGHLQDVDWHAAVHVGASERCLQPLWLEERGTSGDPASTRIVCGCGMALSLRDAQAAGRFGACRGRRPWLRTDEPGGCSEQLRFLTRTATNAYFPQVLTVISLPSAEDELTRLVEAHMDALDWVEGRATSPPRAGPIPRSAPPLRVGATRPSWRVSASSASPTARTWKRRPRSPNTTCSPRAPRRSGRTRRRRGSMPARSRGRIGAATGRDWRRSRTRWRSIACAKCPASRALPGSRPRRPRSRAIWRNCTWRSRARRWRPSWNGCPRSNSWARASSSASTPSGCGRGSRGRPSRRGSTRFTADGTGGARSSPMAPGCAFRDWAITRCTVSRTR